MSANPKPRGLAAVGLALALLSAATPTRGPQAGPRPVAPAPTELGAEALHLASLRAERVADFHAAWQVAGDDRRELVRSLLVDLRSPGAPAEVLPSLGAIDVGTHVLAGEDPEALVGEHPAGVLAIQAMCLDLRVVPGVHRRPGPGDRAPSLVVRLVPLYDLRETLDVDVTLFWRLPGGREVEARREPIAARAFQGEGFEMYVRPPKGDRDGGLQLFAELTPRAEGDDGQHLLRPVRSVAVPVPSTYEDPGEYVRDDVLGPLLDDGLRVAPAPTRMAREHLADLGRSGTLRGPSPPPSPTAPRILVAEPRARAGGPTFGGPLGEAWQQAAEAVGHELVATYPLGSGAVPRIGDALRALGDREVTLVLSGDAALATQLEFLRHGMPELDRLVVIANNWRPSPTLPAVPTLYLTPHTAAAQLAGRAEHVTAEVLDDSIFLSGPAIPGRIAAWLAAQDPGPDSGQDAPR